MKPSICLNMIVRDNAETIVRALESVLPYISKWCICDTGSTDETKDLIHRTLKKRQGVLYGHPWENFGVNRTRAIVGARKLGTDYILTLDADDILVVEDPHCFDDLTAGGYIMEARAGSTRYDWLMLMRADLPWRWVGVVHEYPTCDQEIALSSLSGAYFAIDAGSPQRKDWQHYARHAALLQAALEENPDDARTVFYLAQSYRDAGKIEQAIALYRRRAGMVGYLEEAWYARYQVARLAEKAGRWSEAILAYLDAYSHDPSRAEPLYHLAAGFARRGDTTLSLLFFEEAMVIEKPVHRLFVEASVYDWSARLGYAQVCRARGWGDEAACLEEELLATGAVPDEIRAKLIALRTDQTDTPLAIVYE